MATQRRQLCAVARRGDAHATICHARGTGLQRMCGVGDGAVGDGATRAGREGGGDPCRADA